MSIGPYTISPFINNRQLNTACGLGNHDTENTFLVSSYTSGNPSEVGLCVQGAGGAALDSGATIDITQLWIDFLKSSVNFTIDTPQLTINNNVLMTGSIITEDTTISRKTTVQPSSVEVRDTTNDPVFGDPINTVITPDLIQFQNGNGVNQTSYMSTHNINLTNNDTGLFTDISTSSITMSDNTSSQLNTITHTNILLQDTNLGRLTNINAGSITADTWSIDNTGLGIFDTLTVNSISTVTTLSLTGTTLNIPLGGHAIDKSWAITLNNNVTSLVPTAGVNGGVYKIWLTVGATPRTFTKACGVINDLLGDTLMAAGSVWLITIYKRAASTYRATFDNFT